MNIKFAVLGGKLLLWKTEEYQLLSQITRKNVFCCIVEAGSMLRTNPWISNE
ncbi:MAG: hypothetical protein ACR2N1_09395 [Rubripirellula sp.]